MTGQPKQQFTADQILEAGRRAEAEGQSEYAVQFYRHLTDHHPSSAEASAAREALARLAPTPRQAPEKVNGSRNTLPPWPAAEPPLAPREAAPRPVLAEPPRHAPLASPPPPPTQPAPAASVAQRQRYDYVREPLELPRPVRGYLAGRIVAWFVVLCGTAAFFAGAAIIGFAIATGTVPVLPPVGPPGAIGAALLVAGFVLVFAGQVALASFATANATRETAALMRAIAEDIARRRW
jgi:hypothetical protein